MQRSEQKEAAPMLSAHYVRCKSRADANPRYLSAPKHCSITKMWHSFFSFFYVTFCLLFYVSAITYLLIDYAHLETKAGPAGNMWKLHFRVGLATALYLWHIVFATKADNKRFLSDLAFGASLVVLCYTIPHIRKIDFKSLVYAGTLSFGSSRSLALVSSSS